MTVAQAITLLHHLLDEYGPRSLRCIWEHKVDADDYEENGQDDDPLAWYIDLGGPNKLRLPYWTLWNKCIKMARSTEESESAVRMRGIGGLGFLVRILEEDLMLCRGMSHLCIVLVQNEALDIC